MSVFFDDAASPNRKVIHDDGDAPVSAFPFSFSCWYYPDAVGDSIFQWLGPIGDASGSTDYQYIGFDSIDDATNPQKMRIVHRNGSTYRAWTGNTWTNSAWNHCFGSFDTSNRVVVLNGDWANRGTSTDTLAFNPNNAQMNIGGVRAGGLWQTSRADGYIAEVAMWDVELTQAEVERLAAGLSPLFIRPASLVYYAPMRDWASNNYPAVVNPSSIALAPLEDAPSSAEIHPPIIYPSNNVLQFPARGKIWVNDAATKDGGEVLQTHPGTGWTDTQITVGQVIDTTGLSGQLYLGIERADGSIRWRAITVSTTGTSGYSVITAIYNTHLLQGKPQYV